ncbi:S9 family peptidase [Alteromonas gilva]|uniref:S9 family peptidase n=1 Tax=Alteromonas gilva TaxID=2987522 RepID=A0ABT5L551_9ALTE|nr:S9 family peptidase [Alteromonas gilva]MDC8832182.1 S9 family peptidase [Alteromonas gilva]
MKHFTIKALFASAVLAASLPGHSAEGPVTTFDYQHIFELEYASSPLFTPDDKHIIYERRSNDIMHDRMHTSLWRIDVKTGAHRPLIAEQANVRSPVLSPDGNKLAYLSDRGGSQQLYVRYLDSGEDALLTNTSYSPGNVTWSPDSKTLAFTMFTPAPNKPLFTGMPGKPDNAQWAESGIFIEDINYRSDGAGYVPGGFAQIYILPLDGGTPRQLTFSDVPINGDLDWSHDGKSLLFSTNPSANYAMEVMTSDIYRLAINSGELSQVTSLEGPEGSPKVSPNGKYLAFSHVTDRKLSFQSNDLWVMRLDNGKLTNLTESLDRSVGQFEWAHGSDELYISYDDAGQTRVARIELDGDTDRLSIALGGQSMGRPYTSGEFALSGSGALVFTSSDGTSPADLFMHDKRGQVKQLTTLNNDVLGHLKLSAIEPLTVASSVDDRPIQAWMLTPPDFDASKKYPLILEIHGGPHAAYGPNFSAEIQLMAAKGYVVVWANPRGSTSYGEDFANLIHHNYPSQDYNDLMDVVDGVIAKGSIDTDNLFITGGSGGGVLTAWSIGKTDRFAAAVVAKPVINWMSFALTADAYPYFSQYWMPGMPWEIPDHLWQHSPLSLVGNVTTPTMLLTGEADYRTPISESEQYYQALKLQGVDAAMLRLPGASHGIAGKPSRLAQKVGNILAWFERYRTTPDGN